MNSWELQRAIERVADERIRAATEAGQFDNLPGQGQPIQGLDEPFDPLWWVRRWLKRQDLSPDQRRLLLIAARQSE